MRQPFPPIFRGSALLTRAPRRTLFNFFPRSTSVPSAIFQTDDLVRGPHLRVPFSLRQTYFIDFAPPKPKSESSLFIEGEEGQEEEEGEGEEEEEDKGVGRLAGIQASRLARKYPIRAPLPIFHSPFSNWQHSDNSKMKCHVQFVSTPTADTPGTTLLLHFDTKRYLIGHVAEGTQRAAVQRKVSLAKVGDIFLTGMVDYSRVGGILGMILTLADSATASFEMFREREREKRERGAKKALSAEEVEKLRMGVNLLGGRNLTHFIGTARRFVFRKGLPVYTREFRGREEREREREGGRIGPTFEDDMVRVWSMVVEPVGGEKRTRKRSHEEFVDGEENTAEVESAQAKEDREDQMRMAVVGDMFGSDWKLDRLIKTKLSQVNLPAKIFCRNQEGKIVRYEGPNFNEDPTTPDIEVLVRNPWPGALIASLPSTTPSTTSVCYIFKNHPQRGKFLPQKAIALGVKPPSFKTLTGGSTLTLANGTVVTPDMVMEPGKEGGGFAVIDLPTEHYIDPLLARKEWSDPEVMEGVGAVVWILGPGVVFDPRLLKFMEERKELKHVVSSTDTCSNYFALESPTTAAIRLNMVDPERFPIPHHSLEVAIQNTDASLPYEVARPGKLIQMEPKIEVQDGSIIPYFNEKEVVDAMIENQQEVLQLAKAARDEIATPEYQADLEENQKDIPSKDAELITLGTGSAMPSKYRNVSATLLRVPGYGNYLFDCGENTLGQLSRVFGDELPSVLRDLKVIWISHLHADHHLGMASVIRAWSQETAKHESTEANKLIVASHTDMLNWVKEYAEVEDFGYDRVVPIEFNSKRAPGLTCMFKPGQIEKVGLTSIEACEVEHCFAAMAVSFTFPNGFKVSYSGDCRPSAKFVEIGKGSTVLIHEATFDDELQGDAIAKKHSTTSEAMEVGRKMGARRILLTHFSQRYQKFPVVQGSEHGKGQVAILAFDYMRCKVGDFVKLEGFKEALGKLYEDETEVMEERMVKREEREALEMEEKEKEKSKRQVKKEEKKKEGGKKMGKKVENSEGIVVDVELEKAMASYRG